MCVDMLSRTAARRACGSISNVQSILQAQKAQEKAAAEQKRREAEQRSYKTLMDADSMVSNKNLANQYSTAEEYEDDFM